MPQAASRLIGRGGQVRPRRWADGRFQAFAERLVRWVMETTRPMANDGSSDDERFMRVLTQSQSSLLQYIVGMTPTLADADDVLQEVNLALWKKRRLYKPNEVFLRWAFGFAAVELRRFRDRQASTRIWPSDSLIESLSNACPDDSSIAEQRREALATCVEKLGPTEHQFITEFYAKRMTAHELAEFSGRSLSNVYRVLTRARTALRECVERQIVRQSRPV